MVPQGAFSQRKRQQAYCSSFFLVSWLSGPLPHVGSTRQRIPSQQRNPNLLVLCDNKEPFEVQTNEQECILVSLNYAAGGVYEPAPFTPWKSP